jgi:hypothetical protein
MKYWHAKYFEILRDLDFLVCYLPLLPCQEWLVQCYLRTSVPLTSLLCQILHSIPPDWTFVCRMIQLTRSKEGSSIPTARRSHGERVCQVRKLTT